MIDLTSLQMNAGSLRQSLSAADDQVAALRSRLRNSHTQLDQALRLGAAGAQRASELQARIQQLEASLAQAEAQRDALRQQLDGLLQDVPDQPWDLVQQLGDHLPFLLLPVRIETRFMNPPGSPELWVRIFPDDIAVHSHENALSASELDDGQSFWREMWAAGQTGDPPARQKLEQGAWAKLCSAYGSPRAAWIAGQIRPASLDVPAASSLDFPAVDPESLQPEGWSRAPHSRVMPDRFVVMGYRSGRQIFRQAGAALPNPLILGPDPQKLQSEYQQEDGELKFGPDFAWIQDFDEAVAKGMAVRVPLDSVTAQNGLDHLLVLGLRLSSDASQSQALLEELFDNHHYSPGGLSLLPQGTATNNTDGNKSGYSSAGPEPADSYAVELGPVGFEPAVSTVEKTDAQRLAEALGTAYAPFQRLAFAGQRDWREAQLMNTALFPATGGYYLEEMLNLDLHLIADLRTFFTGYVTGRGPLPVIRVGNQPYGILLSSDFSAWKWSPDELGGQESFLNGMVNVIQGFRDTWQRLSLTASRIGASDDPFQDLLSTLGQNPASVEFFRRYAIGWETLWNYYAFKPGNFFGQILVNNVQEQALALLQELGLSFPQPPRLFRLAFFPDQTPLLNPLVDDLGEAESEKLSEVRPLKAAYRVPDPADPNGSVVGNYLAWLATGSYDDLKQETLQDLAGESQPVPRPLLYRLLRSAVLLTLYDTATRLYDRFNVLPLAVRREIEMANIDQERTLTRWELMDAQMEKVLPSLSNEPRAVGSWLLEPPGQKPPELQSLDEMRLAMQSLSGLPTARLERIFVEHLDLCTYRLDAWQTGCFARRLDFLRLLPETQPAPDTPPDELRHKGIYLGAFGWLVDLRPAPPLQKADLTSIPASLFDPQTEGDLFEQLNNGGFIHAPSLNHAVAAAVLRSAYLTHFDTAQPQKMAVNLSSARVRTALSFLEGVRNGQELGALLGYQFERGLHDRYNDPTLNQFIPFFRTRYPLVADKITPDPDGHPIETKEARNVVDGYTLAEAAFLRETPLPYPYDVQGLPTDPSSSQAAAIQAEVTRLAESLDAIADMLLAEGVFQVTQGNFERAGASLKALTEGGMPPDPEIVKTPRSGTAVHQRVALHLRAQAAPAFWPGAPTQRSRMEPALNRWLGEHLPTPNQIIFRAGLGEAAPVPRTLAGLGLQPIDLVLMTGDELSGQDSELEKRLAYAIRREEQDDSLAVCFEFMASPASTQEFNLFSLLPLLRRLRSLITTARPLSALDYLPPSEVSTDPASQPNPQGYDLGELDQRLQAALNRFETGLSNLSASIPLDGQQNPILAAVQVEGVRSALLALAEFGLPDAVPLSAAGDTPSARQGLAEQGLRLLRSGQQKADRAAQALAGAANPGLPAAAILQAYRLVAQEIFGASFNLIPHFFYSNPAELQAAAAFRDLPSGQGLTRFHSDNALLLDEWLQGAARVRPALANLEHIQILSELCADQSMSLKPLQLPFRPGDHWIAVEYPAGPDEHFSPAGEFVSLVQCLPAGAFAPPDAQAGLLVDEWTEVIPGPLETTGIAVHYNQPGSQPPQTLLLAVTPEITGQWTWDKLVGILNDTLAQARQRAVEPDQLDHTAFAHLLPAVIFSVSRRRLATISTDLIHETSQRS